MENIENILAQILKPIFDIDANVLTVEISEDVENAIKTFWELSKFCENLFINQPIIKRLLTQISNLGDKFCKKYHTCGTIDAPLYKTISNIANALLNFREDIVKLQQTKNQYRINLCEYNFKKFSDQVAFISKVCELLENTPIIVEQIKKIPNETFVECRALKINMLNNLGVQKTKFLKQIKHVLEFNKFNLYSERIQELKKLVK